MWVYSICNTQMRNIRELTFRNICNLYKGVIFYLENRISILGTGFRNQTYRAMDKSK